MPDTPQTFPQGLTGRSLPPAWGGCAAWITMSDGAALWYSECGTGDPLVLLHGWTCSSLFWQRNVPELAKHFRVITMDLRGHGNSAKVLHGHTLARYALDLRELILRLDLAYPVLAGWSMSGSVLMDYWRQFGHHNTIRALALVDSNIGPFSEGGWNCFRMKPGRMDAFNESAKALRADHSAFSANFIRSMFFGGSPSDADLAWMLAEITKTPPWIATAVHSDFVLRNYEPQLRGVSVPTAVFAGVFGEGSLAMGQHFAQRLPKGTLFSYPDAGHLLFYEQAQRFNAELIGFINGTDREPAPWTPGISDYDDQAG